jgi:Uma2 family endonuclease
MSTTMTNEVLSPSTEVVDRGKKFAYYRECRTLQEYVMVDTYKIQIEVYRREDDGWMLHTFGPASNVKFKSLNIQFPIDAVYRKVNLASSRNNKNKKS